MALEYQLSHYHIIKGLIPADTTEKKAILKYKKGRSGIYGNFKVCNVGVMYVSG